MERRKENRIPKNEPVRVAILGQSPASSIPGRLTDLSESGLKIALSSAIPCGSLVRVEGGEFLILGEVCRLEERESEFFIAVKVAHSLMALSELERLNRSILATERPPRARVPVRR